MQSVYSFCENQLKMVKGMVAKRDYSRARQTCVDVINQLREPVIQDLDKTDSIQLIAIAAGEISETYEKEENLPDALKFKRLQRELLDYVKMYESITDDLEEDIPENGNLGVTRDQLLKKVDDTFVLESHLNLDDPQEAMKQILASMERAKEQKVKNALEAIYEANRTPPKKKKIEQFAEFVFNHPFVFVLAIVSVLVMIVLVISDFVKPSFTISREDQDKINDMARMMEKFQREYNEKIKPRTEL